jgi:hypothetical protein
MTGKFPVGRTEFKKSFLRPHAQLVVILSAGSQFYGMTVKQNRFFLNLWADDSRLKENEQLIAIMSEQPTAAPLTIAITPTWHLWYFRMICSKHRIS